MDALFIIGAKYAFALPVLILAYLFIKSGEKKLFVLTTIGSFALAFMVAKILNHVVSDPRPFVKGNFTPLIPHSADNGFPSDHTLLASAAAAVAWIFNRRWAVWAWIFVLVVAVSRVYVGVHHTIDVVGSIVISIASTAVVYLLYKYYGTKHTTDPQ